MQHIKIGLIASLSGPKEHIGRGIVASVQFMLKRVAERRATQSPSIELIVEDDRGQVHEALKCMARCVEAGCALVIGPGDSDSFQAIADDARYSAIPLIATLATATDLARHARGNFFRFTTPNFRRAELLVLQIARLMPNAPLAILTESGAPDCYSQSLSRDVEAAAKENGLSFQRHEFSTGAFAIERPNKKAALVFCAPSASAVALLDRLRKTGVKNQAFGFGSNTNFLTRIAENTIVITDLDRNDSNPKIKLVLEAFFKQFPQNQDPSLPCMNAVQVLVDAIDRMAARGAPTELDTWRAQLIHTLSHDTFDSLLGVMRFTPDGELAGSEQIALSRVRRLPKGFTFSALRDRDRPIRFQRYTNTTKASAAVGVISALTGLISVVQYFFPR